MKYFTPLALLLSLPACYMGQPLQTGPSQNNKTYEVEYLFEHEGCRVYRFRDFGNWVYYTNCNGSTFTRPDSSKVIQNTIKSKN